jgi:hypothetical protein
MEFKFGRVVIILRLAELRAYLREGQLSRVVDVA